MDPRAIFPLSGLAFLFIWIFCTIRENWRRPWRIAGERLTAAFMDEIQNLSQGKGMLLNFSEMRFAGMKEPIGNIVPF